jgi:iron complex outermembrane receptor protein
MGLPLLNPLPATIGFIFDSRPYNRGQTKTSGLDFEATYAIRTGSAGRFEISTNGLYFFNYKYQVSPLAPVRNGLNTITNPLRFRARAGADWELGGLNANIWVNYSNSYKNTTVTPVQTIRSWTTVDAHMGYDFGDHGPLSGLSLSVDVSNLFDARPPYANVLAGYDAQEANAFGRVVTLGVRAKF